MVPPFVLRSHGNEVFANLGHFSRAVLGWPCEAVSDGGWVFKPRAGVCWCHVTALEGWSVLLFKPKLTQHGIVMHPTGELQPLLLYYLLDKQDHPLSTADLRRPRRVSADRMLRPLNTHLLILLWGFESPKTHFSRSN